MKPELRNAQPARLSPPAVQADPPSAGETPRSGLLGSAVSLLLLAFLLACVPARCSDFNGLQSQTLRFLWSRNAFLHVNENDVGAAFKALAETVGRRRGYQVTTTIEIGDAERMRTAIRQDEFEMLIVDSWTYLALDADQAITPRFVSSEQGHVGKQYLLLARHPGGPENVVDLRGKDIALFEVANTSLGRAWLDACLATEGLPTHEAFFGSVLSVGKPSQAVLPVFFGSKAACVVDRTGFEVMTELNPQVGRSLRILATSEVLVDGFICLRNSPWPSDKFKHDLVDTLAELHHEPAGQQILSLVKANQLADFAESQLLPVRKLRAAHDAACKEVRP